MILAPVFRRALLANMPTAATFVRCATPPVRSAVALVPLPVPLVFQEARLAQALAPSFAQLASLERAHPRAPRVTPHAPHV